MARRFVISALIGATALVALPAVASASDICVGTTPIVCPTEDFPANAAGFSAAVSASQGNAVPDRIFLGTGTYSLPSPNGLNFAFSEPIEIIGAGVGQTEFTWGGNATGLAVTFADSTSYMSGFSIDFDGLGTGQSAVQVGGGVIRDFEVTDSSVSSPDSETGVRVALGGTARDFKVSVNAGNIGAAYVGAGTIEGADISATGLGGLGINVSANAPVALKRSKIRGFFEGLDMAIGELTVSDTSFDIGDEVGARGLDLLNSNGAVSANPIVADLDRISVYGTGTNQSGLRLGADTATYETFDGTIDDSIVDVTGSSATAIKCVKAYGQSTTLSVNNTAFDTARYVDEVTPDENCSETFTGTVDITTQIPTYVDADNGDLRPTASSPMIDMLDGSSIASGALDAAGKPRVIDGNGDCIAKFDLGAYEFQLPTQPQCLPPTTQPPTTQPPATPTAPLATAKLTSRAKKAFKRSRSGFRKRTNRRATAFGVTYKNAQVARFEIQRVLRGVKKGKKCKRGTKGGKRCNYFKKIRGIQRQDVFDGEIFYQFGGRIGGKKLKPGNYRVIITPFGEGAVMGTPIAVPFKLK